MSRTNGELRMLNLNIGGLNAKFDKFKLFLTECNDDTCKFPLTLYDPGGGALKAPPSDFLLSRI